MTVKRGESRKRRESITEAHEVAWIHMKADDSTEVKRVLQDNISVPSPISGGLHHINQRPKIDLYNHNALITFLRLILNFG